ncbi:MAG TPA: HlyD family efflux transporter periplasmic adaptor subunit [Desulfobacteraceae bacterium]|nr:HlyD family efflux transporter periplasmic adaptor subunit [Desulfobacteraceae bacterium]
MKKGFLLFIPVAVVLAGSVAAALYFFTERDQRAENAITLYGNVEIREVQLAFQDAGRIQHIAVDEGALVHGGMLLAEIDPARYRLEVQRLEGEVEAQKQLVERLRKGSRPQEIEKARAAEKAAETILADAGNNYARTEKLFVLNKISRQQVDTALSALAEAEAGMETARQELSLALEGPRREDIAQAEAGLRALEAGLDLARQKYEDTRLYAPAEGVIHNRILEPGAMAAPGSPVLTLALTEPLWVRAYITEPDLGRVEQGMRAEIRTDSYPDKVYPGWLGFVSPTAEFTPKSVETPELRTRLVYRARIFVCNPEGELRLGMPVTVTLLRGSGDRPLPSSPCDEPAAGR